VGQENEIATQAGLPAIRLVPLGLSRMMGGSFINTIDVQYSGGLATSVEFSPEALRSAFEQVKKLHFRYLAFFSKLNGNAFGKNLRDLVDSRCGDYQNFAHDLGISLTYLHALMDERIVVSNPSLALLKRMASRLGTTVGFLTGETEDADPVWIASHASWREWIKNSQIDAKIAMDLRDEWRQQYRSQRLVETAASFRKQSKLMSVSDWEDKYKKLKGGAKSGGSLF
jgi:transcriptional regulator with XRE-family HTH domain